MEAPEGHDAPLPVDLAEALTARAHRLRGFAASAFWFDTVGSTNDVAARLADQGAVHGSVVAAGAQQDGRGRMGRRWFSPHGAGLYVSVVLRPGDLAAVASNGPASIRIASSITLTAGVALAEGMRRATGLAVVIKWPNDLLVGGRKVCGILAEAAATGTVVRHVILGYGINIRAAAHPPEWARHATALESERGGPVDRAAVFGETLASLAERFRALETEGFHALLERWRHLAPGSRGTALEVMAAGEWTPAITAGIDADGALLVAVGGEIRRVVAGEVRWPDPTDAGSRIGSA